MVGEMRLAVLAAVDARRVEVNVVCEPHGDGQAVGFAGGGLVKLGWFGQTFAVVRSSHWVLVAACHTCCWPEFRGDRAGGRLVFDCYGAPKLVAPGIAPKRVFCLELWSRSVGWVCWGSGRRDAGTCWHVR